MTLSLLTLIDNDTLENDNQNNNTQHYDTKPNNTQHTDSQKNGKNVLRLS